MQHQVTVSITKPDNMETRQEIMSSCYIFKVTNASDMDVIESMAHR